MTDNEIVETLKHLPPAVAAWLINSNPRSLRDEATCPRNDDGTYDGYKLIRWWSDRGLRNLAKSFRKEGHDCPLDVFLDAK